MGIYEVGEEKVVSKLRKNRGGDLYHVLWLEPVAGVG
jgi:hypothetical protein